MGALAAVNCQTKLLAYVDALKKAKYDRGAKSSFDATTNAVSKLLDRFKLFGACAAALKSALALPEGGPKAATVTKEVLLPTPAALLPPPSKVPKAVQPTRQGKRQLATMQARNSVPASAPDEDFVVSDNHTDSSTDSDVDSQPGSSTATGQVNGGNKWNKFNGGRGGGFGGRGGGGGGGGGNWINNTNNNNGNNNNGNNNNGNNSNGNNTNGKGGGGNGGGGGKGGGGWVYQQTPGGGPRPPPGQPPNARQSGGNPNAPPCIDFQKGQCNRAFCRFAH